jgi:hypothetical protein
VCSQTGEEDFDLAKVVGYKQDMKVFLLKKKKKKRRKHPSSFIGYLLE